MTSLSSGGHLTSESVSDVSGKSRKRKSKTSSDPPKRCRASTPARRHLLAPGVMGGRTFPGELSRFIIAGYENPRVFAGVSSDSGLGGKDPKFRKQFIPTQPQVAAVLARCIPRHLSATFTDEFLRVLVAVLPEAGMFYCHRERRKESVGVANAHVQLDNNWLRVLRNGSCEKRFAKGGYVTRLWGGDPDCMWKWKVNRRSPNLVIPDPLTSLGLHLDGSWTKSVYQVRQCADEDSPRLPPDFFDKRDHYGNWTTDELRDKYLEQYLQSTSARRNCRHYVPGYLHHHINRDQVWVIDPESEGDVDLNVSVHVRHYKGSGKVALFRDSVVQVRYLPLMGGGAVDLVGHVRDHAASILRARGTNGVRGNRGDQGTMHPVGSRIDMDGSRTRYKASSAPSERALLEGCVRAAAQLASTSVPGVLRVMQDVEDDAALLPRYGMKGDGEFARVSHSMDVSVDLSNATHYDVNDASQGFSIWTEDVPGSTRNWYFVLPNVFGKKTCSGPTFNGLVIKLSHGVLISWDGRVIRHGTSMMNRKEGCHVYGTFFAAKSAIVRYGVKRAIATECRRREERKMKMLLAVDGAPPEHNDGAADHNEDVSDGDNDDVPCNDFPDGGNKLVASELLNPSHNSPSDNDEEVDPLVGDLGLGKDDGDEDEDSSSDECAVAFDGVDDEICLDINSKLPVPVLMSVGKSDKSGVDDRHERDGCWCWQEVEGRCCLLRRQGEMRLRQERDGHRHEDIGRHHEHEMGRRQERDGRCDEMGRRQERDGRCDEMGRHDMGRHDMGHHDMGRHDMGRHDMGRHDMGRHDMGRHDMGRHDMGRHDMGRHDMGRRQERNGRCDEIGRHEMGCRQERNGRCDEMGRHRDRHRRWDEMGRHQDRHRRSWDEMGRHQEHGRGRCQERSGRCGDMGRHQADRQKRCDEMGRH